MEMPASHSKHHPSRAHRKINRSIDERLEQVVEQYLDAPEFLHSTEMKYAEEIGNDYDEEDDYEDDEYNVSPLPKLQPSSGNIYGNDAELDGSDGAYGEDAESDQFDNSYGDHPELEEFDNSSDDPELAEFDDDYEGDTEEEEIGDDHGDDTELGECTNEQLAEKYLRYLRGQ